MGIWWRPTAATLHELSVGSSEIKKRSTAARAPAAPGTPSTNCTWNGAVSRPSFASTSALSRWPIS